jgi:hypothetical protein
MTRLTLKRRFNKFLRSWGLKAAAPKRAPRKPATPTA